MFEGFWRSPVHVNIPYVQESTGILAVVLVLLLGWRMRALVKQLAALPSKALVKRKSLITENEAEFLGRLRRALPDFEVSPQVSMGALLDPVTAGGDTDGWQIRRQYQNKVCDYVISKPGAPKGREVVAVVELDDRTHESKRAQDAARDALLRSAGIPTLRFESKRKPSEKEIRRLLLALA